MINVEQRKKHDGVISLSPQQFRHKVVEIGKLGHTKMQASCLIENIDRKNALTLAQRELLKASLTLQTISTKVLAAHLHRTPASIRIEFQRILSVLGDEGRRPSSILHVTEDESFLYSRISDK